MQLHDAQGPLGRTIVTASTRVTLKTEGENPAFRLPVLNELHYGIGRQSPRGSFSANCCEKASTRKKKKNSGLRNHQLLMPQTETQADIMCPGGITHNLLAWNHVKMQ